MTKLKLYTIENGIVETNFFTGYINYLTLHREDGPAVISYYVNGSIEYEEYWYNNKKHRLNGPADIVYDKNGDIQNEWYYINNIQYTEEEYVKELLQLKLQSL